MTITINGTTGIAGVDGSASVPAIQGNDPDTGIYYPAANTVAAAAGGSAVWNASSTFGFKNRIINGGMAIFQRGTAATGDGQYSVDRWALVKANDATESVSQSTDAPVGFGYSLRNTVSVGDASIGANQYSGFEQHIEGFNIVDLGFGTASARSVTLSFWIRSSVTGQYAGNIRNASDTRICPFNFNIGSANTWEFKTVTLPGDVSGTWNTTTGRGITVAFYAAAGSSILGGTNGVWGAAPNYACGSPVNAIASNGNIFAITGVQLEAGPVATSFDFRPIGTEFMLCQRYYQRYASTQQSYAIGPFGYCFGPSSIAAGHTLPVPLRASPAISFGGGLTSRGGILTGNNDAFTVSGVSSIGFINYQLTYTVSVTSGAFASGAIAVLANGNPADNSTFIAYSSEL